MGGGGSGGGGGEPRLAKQRKQALLPSTCSGGSEFWPTPASGLDPWGLGCGGADSEAMLSFRESIQGCLRYTRPSPLIPHLPGGRCKRGMLGEPLSRWDLPLPSRPCPAIWPWPRTQGPAFACCRRSGWGGAWAGQVVEGMPVVGILPPEAVCSASFQTM